MLQVQMSHVTCPPSLRQHCQVRTRVPELHAQCPLPEGLVLPDTLATGTINSTHCKYLKDNEVY